MSPEGRKMIYSYGNDVNCPLRSMVKEGEGLGQRILHELRKVGEIILLWPDVINTLETIKHELRITQNTIPYPQGRTW